MNPVKELIDMDLIKATSAAYITYMLHRKERPIKKLNAILSERIPTEEEQEQYEIIKELSDPEDFFKWMRRCLSGKPKFLLRELMLDHEDNIMEMVKRKILTNGTDDFIECTADFFIDSREDVSSWIVDNYERIRSPYAKSQMCLVLGFRGKADYIHFLLMEFERFFSEYAEERLEQGPLIAIYMLSGYEDLL